MTQPADLLKRPLYVYDLPAQLLSTLAPKGDDHQQPAAAEDTAAAADTAARPAVQASDGDSLPNATSCGLCGVTAATVADQRAHAKSDIHRFNLKRKLRGEPAVAEGEFETMVDGLNENESISGSDSESDSSSGAETDGRLSQLLRRKAAISASAADDGDEPHRATTAGAGKAPLLWFTSPLLPPEISLGVYRAIFSTPEQQSAAYLSALQSKQLSLEQPRHMFLCMIGGGHFAASIISLTPKIQKRPLGDERTAVVLAAKTFHRYTTRRKQGGAQSANDNSKGNAHSAGSSLRRYNEAALTAEVRELLGSWAELIGSAELLFIRATGTANRRTLFGYEGAPLKSNDPRIRGFPFTTRRPTQSELIRCFTELTRVKVSQVDAEALAAQAAQEQAAKQKQAAKAAPEKPAAPQYTKEEEEALLHTSQLTALIRRSKAPAVLSYLTSNNLPADYAFFPPAAHHHSPTPLHLAASLNSPAVVLALLTKASAAPLPPNGDGKTAFELAGDRATRDAFRIARAELGERKWAWDEARVAPALGRKEVEARDKREREEGGREEKQRRERELEKIKEEEAAKGVRRVEKRAGAGKSLGGAAVQMGMDRQQIEMGGMSAEARQRLERERRARAAEERIRKMQGR